MIAKQRLNPEIWEFWSRTHKAWADGVLSPLDACFQQAARNALMIEHFVDDSPNVVAAIRALNPGQDEFLMGYSTGDCDTLLTNQRLMVRDKRSGRHDIYALSDIAGYTTKGWWTGTVSVTLRSGLVRNYPQLGGVIKDEYLRYAISQCRSASTPHAQAPTPPAPPIVPRTSLAPTNHETSSTQTVKPQQEGDENMSESEGEMIGSEYPVIQQLIKNRLQAGETLLAFATALTTPTGNVHWVPFVGGLLELGRAVATKHYILGVTEQRFLIIQINKWSRITKEVHEVSFDDVPIKRIRTVAAQSRFLDSLVYGDEFKLEAGDGRKYHFRKISKEHGAMLRDAILGAQDGKA